MLLENIYFHKMFQPKISYQVFNITPNSDDSMLAT
jgi:hypothetical protein